MADDTTGIEAFVSDLSKDERQLLMDALRKTEWQLYQLVLRRLRIWLVVAFSAITLFGVAAVATIRTAAIDAAANKLATDSDVRNQVVADTTKKLQRVNEILANADRLQHDVDAERERALTVVGADLGRIIQMTTQLQNDVATSRSSGDSQTAKHR
jgi:beta-lactamase regulating signal transducer with metallopeptidase domain